MKKFFSFLSLFLGFASAVILNEFVRISDIKEDVISNLSPFGAERDVAEDLTEDSASEEVADELGGDAEETALLWRGRRRRRACRVG